MKAQFQGQCLVTVNSFVFYAPGDIVLCRVAKDRYYIYVKLYYTTIWPFLR